VKQLWYFANQASVSGNQTKLPLSAVKRRGLQRPIAGNYTQVLISTQLGHSSVTFVQI
jgi:hypothetical protein